MSYFEDFLNEPVKKEKKEDVKKVKPIKAPKTQKEEVGSEKIDVLMEELSKTSDFKRLIYRAITGKSHRGSKDSLNKELSEILETIQG